MELLHRLVRHASRSHARVRASWWERAEAEMAAAAAVAASVPPMTRRGPARQESMGVESGCM